MKEKCLLIHVSTREHIKTRQTCNSFSLHHFQEEFLLFFALFYYSFLFLEFERGVATPVIPPLDPPMPISSNPACIRAFLKTPSPFYIIPDFYPFLFEI